MSARSAETPVTSLIVYEAPGPLVVAGAVVTEPIPETVIATPLRAATIRPSVQPLATPAIIPMHAVQLSSVRGELTTGFSELTDGLRRSGVGLQRLGRTARIGAHHLVAHITHETPNYIAALQDRWEHRPSRAQATQYIGRQILRAYDSDTSMPARRLLSAQGRRLANLILRVADNLQQPDNQ